MLQSGASHGDMHVLTVHGPFLNKDNNIHPEH